MSIPIKQEPDQEVAGFGGILEQCHFCKKQTRYWHENTNNPVCPACAKTHRVAELPDWGKAIRASKRKTTRLTATKEQPQ